MGSDLLSRHPGTAELAGTILLVEDEPTVVDAIRFHLERERYSVRSVTDGRSALREFHSSNPILVLIDLMIPEISGLELCRIIRAESTVPIIVVTARDSEADKVLGLELGADDYVTKPFSVNELLARIRANLRRASMGGADSGSMVRAGPVAIDAERHEVMVRGEAVEVTPKEFAVLHLLVERKGRLLSRHFLIDEVWGSDFKGMPNTLDVHIRRIREKVEADPANPRHIVTVRGLGYKFQE
jgi:two-component system response regulator RegX3